LKDIFGQIIKIKRFRRFSHHITLSHTRHTYIARHKPISKNIFRRKYAIAGSIEIFSCFGSWIIGKYPVCGPLSLISSSRIGASCS